MSELASEPLPFGTSNRTRLLENSPICFSEALSYFLLCPSSRRRLVQRDVDFSNYDVPLYTQIVDRIKAKVSARLGEGS